MREFRGEFPEGVMTCCLLYHGSFLLKIYSDFIITPEFWYVKYLCCITRNAPGAYHAMALIICATSNPPPVPTT